MNIFTAALNAPPRVIDLESGKPLSLHLPRGSVVYSVLGTLWITQEGLVDDIVLKAGEQFAVRAKGQLVVSAVDGAALAYIAAPGEAIPPLPATAPQVLDALTARAVRLRRQEMARFARLAAAVIARTARRLKTLWRRRRRFPVDVRALSR
jgi:Protein of unknown function (DUF2917)